MIDVNDQTNKKKFRVLSSNKPVLEISDEIEPTTKVEVSTPKSLTMLKHQSRSISVKLNYLVHEITK